METKYAIAERALREQIEKSFNTIKDNQYIEQIINALPYIGAILNSQRQVVFANAELLKLFEIETFEQILGKRTGEVLHCQNSKKEIGGCGTSKNCTVCGAVNTILESQRTNKQAESECRITSEVENEAISFDFKVTTIPINVEGEQYFVCSMVDISDEKRRLVLERIFFHDLINKAGNIKGITDLISGIKEEEKLKEMLDLLSDVSEEMLDEIMAQRQLNWAENDDLVVSAVELDAAKVIKSIAVQMGHHHVASEKKINTDCSSDDFTIRSDEALLKRVLINMLKNALEASPKNSTVTIGCTHNSGEVIFWVHNPVYIPKDIQLQIFMRSFSTKGANRGLGTYSMKLLGEKYLGGKVYYVTNEKEGTTFSIQLPVD